MDIIKNFFLTKKEMTRQKLRVKLKTTFFVSIASAAFFATLIAIVYFLGYSVLRDKGIESQSEMARTLASSVDSAIEKQSELLKLSANSQFVIDAVKEDNLKYRVKSEREIQAYLMDMDKRWIEAPTEHPILKEYLENKISLKLRELKGNKEELITVLVADRFGGLVGATTKPSGFYSFDQDWWLNSYAKDRGKLFIGNAEYDEEKSLWALPFAAPVEDGAGNVIGVCKASIKIDTFFKPLLNFKIGKTGNAVLADNKAFILYHYKSSPFANKFCEYEEFQKTLQNNEGWGTLDSAYLNRGKTLTAYSEVSNPLLSAKGINWFVFVERDLGEILTPLYQLIFTMMAIGIALTIILALSVFILSGQETPGYSMLQVVKEVKTETKTEMKIEDKNNNRTEDIINRLPKDDNGGIKAE